MNERTNKPSRPIVVGFGSVPGGTGCTTLATHAATYAARQGLHTLAISIDPSADMLRRMGVDQLYIDAYWIKDDQLKLAFMPPEFFIHDVVTALPNLGFGGEVRNPDIIFLDLGPGIVQSGAVSADFWVVPIQDTRSFDSIKSRTYPQGSIRTFFVLSKVPYGDKKCLLSSVSSLVNDLPDGKAQLIYSDIPNSGLILRTQVECKTIWELSSRSQSTRDIDYFCKKLLSLVNEDRTKVQSSRDSNIPSSSGPLPSDDVQDETLKAAQSGLETTPTTQDKTDEQQKLERRIEQGFQRELERLRKGIRTATQRGVSNGAQPASSPGPLPSDDVQDEALKAAQAGIETNPPTQDKPDDKQRRITHGFEREIERLLGTGVVPKASRRKK